MKSKLIMLLLAASLASVAVPVTAHYPEPAADRTLNIGQAQCTTTTAVPTSTTQAFGSPENFSVVFADHGRLILKAGASIVGTLDSTCILSIELVGVRYAARPGPVPGFPPNGGYSGVISTPCTAIPSSSTSTCTATLQVDWWIDFANMQNQHVTTDILFDVNVKATAVKGTLSSTSVAPGTAWLWEPSVPKV